MTQVARDVTGFNLLSTPNVPVYLALPSSQAEKYSVYHNYAISPLSTPYQIKNGIYSSEKAINIK